MSESELDVPAYPSRQIRATYSDSTVTVYQAFSVEIANAAVAAGRFVPPFKRDRMTWIKPSFLWMMYRSGWAAKPGQECVLAVEITRAGFEWALAHASLSHFDPAVHATPEEWQATRQASVRIQWDPERDIHLRPLPERTIQIGLSGDAANHYVDEWVESIRDITALAHRIGGLVAAGSESVAADLLPQEVPYTISSELGHRIGVSGSTT
jgi:hypothetical protein